MSRSNPGQCPHKTGGSWHNHAKPETEHAKSHFLASPTRISPNKVQPPHTARSVYRGRPRVLSVSDRSVGSVETPRMRGEERGFTSSQRRETREAEGFAEDHANDQKRHVNSCNIDSIVGSQALKQNRRPATWLAEAKWSKAEIPSSTVIWILG